jgi:hypothetical protein
MCTEAVRTAITNVCKDIQMRLTALGYYSGPIDGDYYGGLSTVSPTATAVSRFQEAKGLPQTGILDSQTRAILISSTPNYGTVFSTPTSGCGGLTTAQMECNAQYIYSFMTVRGWSKNAICAMLGNMEAESGLNPCAWQFWHQTGAGCGFGLVQWTPATNYLNWAGLTPSQVDAMQPKELMDSELNYILYQLANGGQWYATSKAPYYMSFEEFTHSTYDTYNLALTWQASFERPQINDSHRGDIALKWYNFFN